MCECLREIPGFQANSSQKNTLQQIQKKVSYFCAAISKVHNILERRAEKATLSAVDCRMIKFSLKLCCEETRVSVWLSLDGYFLSVLTEHQWSLKSSWNGKFSQIKIRIWQFGFKDKNSWFRSELCHRFLSIQWTLTTLLKHRYTCPEF